MKPVFTMRQLSIHQLTYVCASECKTLYKLVDHIIHHSIPL